MAVGVSADQRQAGLRSPVRAAPRSAPGAGTPQPPEPGEMGGGRQTQIQADRTTPVEDARLYQKLRRCTAEERVP